MKKRILIIMVVLLSLILWLVYITQVDQDGTKQTQEQKEPQEQKEGGNKAQKLRPGQVKQVSTILANGILQKYHQAVTEQAKMGFRFKRIHCDIKIQGNLTKGSLSLSIKVFVFESSSKKVSKYRIWRKWPKCPEPDSPEIEKAINFVVERLIFFAKVSETIIACS